MAGMKTFEKSVWEFNKEELTTEDLCIEWVRSKLPFLIRSKKGKLQYPFKAAYAARMIEENLGKELFKLLNK
jgi:hypothetical protein